MSAPAAQLRPSTRFERGLARYGVRFVAGLDEAGRGALAGPVVAAAVVLPRDDAQLKSALIEVRDSKEMTPAARAQAFVLIQEVALASSVGVADNVEVDSYGIIQATRLAMMRALRPLAPAPEHLLLDYMILPDWPTPQTSLVRGDARVLSIAAASVLAKVTRDRMMSDYDQHFPGYSLTSNKGYGTRAHKGALKKLGPCPIHRKSYAPIRLQLECRAAGAS